MSQTDRPENERLERLLRRWGAEEAANEESAAAPPLARPQPVASALRRYAPLAAAAVLFLVAAGLFSASRSNAPALPSAANEPEAGLSQLKADLQQTRAALAQAQASLEAQRKKSAGEMAVMQKQAEIEKASLQATLDARTQEFAIAMTAQKAELKTLTERTTTQADTIATLQARQKEQADLREELLKQYNGLLAEMSRLREAAEASRTAQQTSESRLAAAQSEQAALAALVQKMLLAMEMHEEPLQARQAAARQSQLIRRIAPVREQVSNPETRRLLDTLEILLTQLDLLNPADVAEVQAFSRRLRQSDIPRRVGEVLQNAQLSSAVRAWLVESEVVLVGVDHAL
jgi:chromosome segregation ATPase